MKEIRRKITTYLFHSNTIFVQLVLFTLIVSIVPIGIIGSLLFSHLSSSVEETLNESYSQIAKQYVANMNESLLRYQYRLHQIADNTIIIDELLNRGQDTNPYVKGKKVTVEVRKCLGVEDYNKFRNCMVYSNIKDAKIYGDKVSMIEEARKESWYSEDRILSEGIFTYLSVDRQENILSLIEPIYYIDTESLKKDYLGFVKLDIDTTKLFEPPKDKKELTSPYDIIVLDEEESIVYTSNIYSTSVLEGLAFDQLSSHKMIFKDNKMIYGDRLNLYKLKVLFIFENDFFDRKQETLQNSILWILFLLISLIGITTYLFTRSFSRRVGCLIQKIRLAEEGNFTVTEEIAGNDEITILDRHFNIMLKRLDELIQKNYIQQLEKKEAQLKSLQLQINPHFLYNTLETISSLAAVKHAFDICDLCEKLGDIFRYSLGKNYGEYVPLEQEIRHIQNYIFIQKARFGNKFDVVYNLEQDLLKNQVLRFILQPIVENALSHGLNMKQTKGILTISIKKDEECICVEVEDNGVGMELNQLIALKEYIQTNEVSKEDKKKGIGIRNVNQRIKLACGNQYGITIRSKPNEGTCFTIKLPFIQ